VFNLPCPRCSNKYGLFYIAYVHFEYKEGNYVLEGTCQKCSLVVTMSLPVVVSFTPEGAACV